MSRQLHATVDLTSNGQCNSFTAASSCLWSWGTGDVAENHLSVKLIITHQTTIRYLNTNLCLLLLLLRNKKLKNSPFKQRLN